MRPTIVFDLDDTLVDLSSAIIENIRSKYPKTALKIKDYYSSSFLTEEQWDYLRKIKVYNQARQFSFNVEYFKTLQRRGFRIVISTARHMLVKDGMLSFSRVQKDTEDQLKKIGVSYDELRFNPIGDKLKGLRNVIALIDDHLPNFNNAPESVYKILIWKPHNQIPFNEDFKLHRVFAIRQALDLLGTHLFYNFHK